MEIDVTLQQIYAISKGGLIIEGDVISSEYSIFTLFVLSVSVLSLLLISPVFPLCSELASRIVLPSQTVGTVIVIQ